MVTKRVAVTIVVDVTLDETKFDEEFLSMFKSHMYSGILTLDDHAKHLAQMRARNLYNMLDMHPHEFVEGYGEIGDMGISAKVVDQEEEIEEV